jgi:hypothetical protein
VEIIHTTSIPRGSCSLMHLEAWVQAARETCGLAEATKRLDRRAEDRWRPSGAQIGEQRTRRLGQPSRQSGGEGEPATTR